MTIKKNDIIIAGFALFAIFFGAGNLIFPPYLGVIAGSNWLEATIGFFLSDPLLPILGVLVTFSLGGRAQDLGARVSKRFAIGLSAISISIIGPLFAVPRTAATTHEIMVQPLFASVPAIVTSIIFFGITLIVVLNPSKVMDVIGQYLTPLLLIILFVIIGLAVFNPDKQFGQPLEDNLFRLSFNEGYQTMDALSANLMAGIVISDLIRRGYMEKKIQFRAAIYISILALALLAFVYGGLLYAGASFSQNFSPEMGRVNILLATVEQLMGPMGQIILGICVALACLTTAIGLISIFGEFFASIQSLISYNTLVIGGTFVAFFISLIGVDDIIAYAGPVLTAIYPVVIVLVIFSAFDRLIKWDQTYLGAVLGTLLISIPQALFELSSTLGSPILEGLNSWTESLPLSSYGFEWLIPAIIVAAIFTVAAMILKPEQSAHQLEV